MGIKFDFNERNEGVLVRYKGVTSEYQISYGGHDDPRGILEEGKVYTIAFTLVGDWRTEVHLVGYEDKDFNSVHFEDVLN